MTACGITATSMGHINDKYAKGNYLYKNEKL